jgi:hypothetical protein
VTRKLQLPSGGTYEIPMPGTRGSFVERPATFRAADVCPHLAPTVLLPLAAGLVIGGLVTWLVLHNR